MVFPLESVRTHGAGLNRPECLLTHRSGYLFCADWEGSGGVSMVHPNGKVDRFESRHHFKLRPNGIALEPDGAILLAHLGAETGGIYRQQPDGSIEVILDELDGQPLPPANFVTRDKADRIWLTISTSIRPRAAAYRASVADGYIVMIRDGIAEIVADGLGYTNECLITEDGRTLYVNETFGRRLSAFDISPSGKLGNRRTVTTFGPGTFPDGLCMDVPGNLWVTSIVSNRVIRVSQSGQQEIYLEDNEPDFLEEVETAFMTGSMGRPHLDNSRSRLLRNISSLAFGGPDLRTGYLGCLLGDCAYEIEMPDTGLAPIHWDADISAWTGAMSRQKE